MRAGKCSLWLEGDKGVMELSMERIFQTEETANAKALQQECIQSVSRTLRRTMWEEGKVLRGRIVNVEVRSKKNPNMQGHTACYTNVDLHSVKIGCHWLRAGGGWGEVGCREDRHDLTYFLTRVH